MTKTVCTESMWLYWIIWALMCQSCMTQRRLCGKPLADTLDFLCAGRGFHMGKRDGRSIGSVYSKQLGVYGRNIRNNHPHNSSNRNGFLSHSHKEMKVAHGNIGDPAKTQQEMMSLFNRKRLELVNFLKNVNVTIPYNYTEDYYRQQQQQQQQHPRADNDERTGYRDGNYVIPQSARVMSPVIRKRRQAQALNIVEECCLRPCTIRTLLSYCAAPDDEEDELPEHVVRQWFRMTSPSMPTTTSRPRNSRFRRPPAQINRGTGRNRSQFFYVPSENQATRSPLLIDRQSESES